MTEPAVKSRPKQKFQLSYTDYIRKFKAQRVESNALLSDLSTINHFPNHMFDINLVTEPVKKIYWYKKCFRKHHEYELDVFNSDVTENSQINCYSELQGTDGWLSTTHQFVDDDFLTGYYIGKELVRVRNETVNWFHFGCMKTQLSKGLNANLDTNSGRFTRYGADRRLKNKLLNLNNGRFDYKIGRQSRLAALDDDLVERKVVTNLDNVFNGVTKSGELADTNVIKSIRNQLTDLTGLKFLVSDVYPKNMQMLFNSVLIPLTDVDAKGFSFIRLPDPHTWGQFKTMMVSFLILVSSYWTVSKIFKTPWGEAAKYYLVLSDRNDFSTSDYTSLVRYIKSNSDTNTPLLSKKFDFTSICPVLNELQTNLLNCYEYKTNEDANAYWLEHIVPQ